MVAGRIAEGLRVLVVEDEMMIVLQIENTLLGLGSQIVGPAANLDAGLRLAEEETIDAAILDINIRGGTSYPIADVLADRGIPFLFCSGYSEWAMAERHRDRPRLTKPYSATELENGVLRILARRSTDPANGKTAVPALP